MEANTKKFQRLTLTEFFLMILGMCVSSAVAWYVYSSGLTLYLTDQFAHLLTARMTVTGMTPGISQIGTWGPLLHVIMAPFSAIDPLYESGLAGFAALLPFYLLGILFIYRTCLHCSENKILSMAAALVFLLNPYTLYFTVTPMTEVLFIANVAGTAYFLARWYDNQNLGSLFLCGTFISLACISRYEGLLLLPIVSLAIIVKQIALRKKYSESEALLLLFAMFGMAGIAFIFVYGWIYAGSPLGFLSLKWLPASELSIPHANGWKLQLQHILAASYLMMGQPEVYLAAGSLPVLLLFKHRVRNFFVALVLLSPVIFVSLTIVSGRLPLLVENLPPFFAFHNVRYALTWLGFAAIVPALAASSLLRIFNRVPILHKMCSTACAVILIGFAGTFTYRTWIIEGYAIIPQHNDEGPAGQRKIAAFMHDNYDYGKILTYKYANESTIVQSKLPLEDFILEYNDQFFRNAITRPWLFARMVIVSTNNTFRGTDEFHELEKTESFKHYYHIAYEDDMKKIYALNEDTLREDVPKLGLIAANVPSLNPSIISWEPEKIDEEMTKGIPKHMPQNYALLFNSIFRAPKLIADNTHEPINPPNNTSSASSVSSAMSSLSSSTSSSSSIPTTPVTILHSADYHSHMLSYMDVRALITKTCGNKKIDAYEKCDDGNTDNGDTCSALCQPSIPILHAAPIQAEPDVSLPFIPASSSSSSTNPKTQPAVSIDQKPLAQTGPGLSLILITGAALGYAGVRKKIVN
ncbi:MAG: hypothetical protein JWM56_45 [Candidatus Peribacteria bacterium]|nr:hypothetical protein [Candidatus Peribacteria bacterium]